MRKHESSRAPWAPSSRPRLGRAPGRLREAGPWLALILLAAWARELSIWWLPVAGLLAATGFFPLGRISRARTVGLLLLLAGALAGFLSEQRLGRVSRDWQAYWEAREAAVFQDLTTRIEDVLTRGERAVEDVVRLVERSGGPPPPERLEELRRAAGFPALVVYDPEGRPAVWAGTHRGRVPDAVRMGTEAYAYGELPLFSYLYFTAPIPLTGGTAAVAYLLRTDLPRELHADMGDLVSSFRGRTGEDIRISTAERAAERAVYDLQWNDETLFSVSVVRPAEAERRRQVEVFWMRVVGVLLGGAWIFLAISGAGERRSAVTAVAALALLAALLPWRALFAEPELFRAANFLLPGPWTVTLGRLLALALVGGVAAGLLVVSRRGILPALAAPAAVALGFPLLLGLVSAGASASLLVGEEAGWTLLQLTLAALLSLLVLAALASARRPEGEPHPLLFLPAAAAALLLGSVAAWRTYTHAALPVWAAAAWALPVLLLLPALRGWAGWRSPLVLWLSAVVLGTSAALPHAWSLRVQARMAMAERQLERVGAGENPYLRFLMGRLGAAVDSLHVSGAGPVELLYRGWLDSRLAEEGYPIWMTLWSSGGIPREELRIGVGNLPRPSVAGDFQEDTRRGDTVTVRRFDDPAVHYMVQVPLSDGSVVSGVVPPMRAAGAVSPLGPLFGAVPGDGPEPLTLVPLIEGDALLGDEAPRWFRTGEGWRGEVGVVFPDATYNAQYRVDLPGPPILVARAALLLAFNLAVLLAFWGLGRLLARGADAAGTGWRRLLSSFRARVTLALFGFFLLSNAIFGTLAYRNISDAAVRAAQVLAERVAQDAAELYLDVGRMDLLAGRVGGDLLEYRDGQLWVGATEEFVELGLYEGLLPYDVYAALSSGRELVETRGGSLGRWEYVTAFRRLADGDILAVPVPLQAGATAVRRQEVAHLLAFAIVAGAALSLVLALLVGRTLTRPIRTLLVASERVGSGNLRVRLPAQPSDEFGAVFSAFNRMVRRLRKARRALVRTTRRTQAIVEDAATGVIALDAQGRVTLVNPRAEALLGRHVPLGLRLSDTGGAAGELVRWTRRYYRDGLRETASDFQLGERRIRVRARRITRVGGPLAGAVLSLEDVTDELRTERILAWGEMARQVAHEVKNPLTPIKLSIQHIQRAWRDRRVDFDEILTRNADAMLREIDRLAAIASSFSRFGAPSAAGDVPLEPVRVGEVVSEVLTLYGTGEGAIRFERDVSPGLPPVSAREAEMKEVLVNLLENARAAIADGGTVCVEAREAGGGVVLRVRDDGTGIPAEILPRIFEPHFSTRSSGTGLGLAIVRRLVESWDAAVSVQSEPGEGTVIHVWLRPWDGSGPPMEDGGGEERGNGAGP